MVKPLLQQVLMNGILVGELSKLTNGVLQFCYHHSWLDRSGARPISLSMPLSDNNYRGDLVYNFFDNLLPDNQQIRARIQTRFRAPTNQPFDLLSYIGRDCIGAIQIITPSAPDFEKKINFKTLTTAQVASHLRNYKINPLGMNDESQEFRISLAGAQEKTALLFHDNQWCEPLQQTPTTHILKLPIGNIEHHNIDLSDSCENEWLCAQLAKAYGLAVADCEILSFEDIKVLSVKRFDRRLSSDNRWIMRLPQEDMCQALGVSYQLKYQSDGGPGIIDIMNLLLGSQNAIEDRDNFMRSQIFFWLIAAIDGHGKNFSLFLEAGGNYRLTPLYDIISAYPLMKSKKYQTKKVKMAMALHGKNKHYHWHKIQTRHFIETAKKAKFSPDRTIALMQQMLQQTDEAITKVSQALPDTFPRSISEPIFDGLLKAQQRFKQGL